MSEPDSNGGTGILPVVASTRTPPPSRATIFFVGLAVGGVINSNQRTT